MALLDKMPHRKGVLVDVAACEALVRHVKEGKVSSILDCLRDLLPLLERRVDSRRIMRTCVEQEHASLGCSFNIAHHPFKVEANRLLIVVSVLLHLKAGILEHSRMVRPGGCRDVDLLGARIEAREEGAADAKRARTRDGLRDGETGKRRRVGAIGEGRGFMRELGDASYASVFLVETGSDDLLLGSADGREDVGLAGVVAVGADA